MRRSLLLLALVAVVALLISIAPPCYFCQQKNGAMANSFNHMKSIGFAILAYKSDNDGTPPRKLSDVIPQYGLTSWFILNSDYSTPMGNPDFDKHPELIDSLTPYRFQDLHDGRVVVFERPGFWKDDPNITYCVMANLKDDPKQTSSNHVSPQELERRFPGILSPQSPSK
jgi:hypothetical protein